VAQEHGFYGEERAELALGSSLSTDPPRCFSAPTLSDSVPSYALEASPNVHTSLVEEIDRRLDVRSSSAALVVGQVPHGLVAQLSELPLRVDVLPYGDEIAEDLKSLAEERDDIVCLEGDFESIDLDGSSYDVILTMNSWNQITQGIRSAKAARLLRWGGGLIPCWTAVALSDPLLGHALHVALRSGSDCVTDQCKSHRLWGDHDSAGIDGDLDELRSSALFSSVEEFAVSHEWSCDPEEFKALVHRSLTPSRDTIDSGSVELSQLDRFFSDRDLSSLTLQSSTQAYVALL
jgi:hypothetical protein